MDGLGDKYIARLLEISNKKYEHLKNILALTQKQAEYIVEDGVDSLQELIDKKQKVIEEIDRLDEEYSVYFQRFKTGMKISSLSELEASKIAGAGELKEITGKLLAVIQEISGLEQQNRKKANELFSRFGEELNKISAGKKITSVYTQKAISPPSFFIDKKK